jgi:nuclear pore complex protein Nup85
VLLVIRTVLRGLTKASEFFLDTLSRHPSEHLQGLSQQLHPLLKTHPRLIHFSTERDFVIANRRWRDKVKSLRLELDRVPEEDRRDDFENWWNHFSDIAGILEGRYEVIQRVCVTLGADWKEVCAAWGVFVDYRIRRQDLPYVFYGHQMKSFIHLVFSEVVGQVLHDMPPDPTNLEDMVHAALFSGQPVQALSHAAQLDIWLAAHLADMMEPLELLETEVDEE